ncbi:MAG TPA: Gfo/Idh/MocA family oxidoreductase [Caulobacteraceae bacterium]|nr:Gfo/Idh/MocA family oxidoreductase [Caulobacteraceae bacterium]
MSRVLRAGVVGAGVFGGYHAHKYVALADVELAAVFDPDMERAKVLARELGVAAVDDLAALLALSDVVSIASPATVHAEQALAALRAGRSVYVEKPLATSLEDADRLIAAARGGPVLACGHLERVRFAAMGLLDVPEPPAAMFAVRKGPWSSRNPDVSCVLDLMIHDIDLALALNPAEPLAVEAEARTTHGPLLDEVRADVTLSDGSTVILEASRIAEARERRMRLVYGSGEVEIDFLTGEFSNTTPYRLDSGFADTPAGKDQLGASLQAFLDAVRGETARPAVTGEEAARALDLALAIEQAAGG